MCWVISAKLAHSAEMAAIGARTTYAFRFLFRISPGTIPRSARRIKERR